MRGRDGLLVLVSSALCCWVGCSGGSGGEMLDPGPATVTVDAAGADYASIQRAIDASPPGTMIRIASGTYAEHVVIQKRLTLIGAGPATVVELPAGSLAKGAIEVSGAAGVSLHDLTVLATALDVDGIHVEDSTDIVIDSVVVSGTGDEGVHVENSSDVEISGVFTNNADHGVHVREGSTRVTVSDSQVSGNVKDGIRITESSDCIVRNNTVAQNGDDGILVRFASSGIVIDANSSTLNGDHGVRVRESTGGQVTDNVSTQNSGAGIWVTQPAPGETQVVVEDNTAHSNGGPQELVD